LKLLLLLFIFLNISVLADENKYSFRAGYGLASENDLGEILLFDYGSHPRDLSVYSFDGGYLLKKSAFDWPLDIYVKGGLSYYDEDLFSDTFEAVVYIKAYWNFDFWKNRVRLGVGEGLSYVGEVLEAEAYEAELDDDETSRFLNYLDFSVDFDLGKLVKSKMLEETYVGYAIKHRSGVFGLFNGVHGGSNYNTFYLETNF
jgi:outer membrane protein